MTDDSALLKMTNAETYSVRVSELNVGDIGSRATTTGAWVTQKLIKIHSLFRAQFANCASADHFERPLKAFPYPASVSYDLQQRRKYINLR